MSINFFIFWGISLSLWVIFWKALVFLHDRVGIDTGAIFIVLICAWMIFGGIISGRHQAMNQDPDLGVVWNVFISATWPILIIPEIVHIFRKHF
jgi:hypothetical protein